MIQTIIEMTFVGGLCSLAMAAYLIERSAEQEQLDDWKQVQIPEGNLRGRTIASLNLTEALTLQRVLHQVWWGTEELAAAVENQIFVLRTNH